MRGLRFAAQSLPAAPQGTRKTPHGDAEKQKNKEKGTENKGKTAPLLHFFICYLLFFILPLLRYRKNPGRVRAPVRVGLVRQDTVRWHEDLQTGVGVMEMITI